MKETTSGIVGMIFLILCISFVSFLQPASRQASAHPFLAPEGSQYASAATVVDDVADDEMYFNPEILRP